MLGGLGLLVLAIGLALLGWLPPAAGTLAFIWRMSLCGLGFGFFQAPNNRTILASAPRARSGAAGGMLSSARLVGQTLGATGVAILFRACGEAGSHFALYLAACLALIGAVVSTVRLRGHVREQLP
jgi:DHA2 family multidrug resistance protein-like MFS transporter